MSFSAFDHMIGQIEGGAQKLPPLDQWDPPLSGAMDMRIASDGRWFHEGQEIHREQLVKAFASILRYEPDNGFVLLTPVEKWIIEVDQCPFIAIDVEVEVDKAEKQIVWLRTNVDEVIKIDAEHPFYMKHLPSGEIPVVRLRPGIEVKLNRACYYYLADLAVESDGSYHFFSDGECFAF